jgi:hypothetical protein
LHSRDVCADGFGLPGILGVQQARNYPDLAQASCWGGGNLIAAPPDWRKVSGKSSTRGQVLRRLANAEAEHGVRIRSAIESGSRPWRAAPPMQPISELSQKLGEVEEGEGGDTSECQSFKDA